MVHRNAPLSETGRLRLARCVVDEGWPLRRAAERFQVSHTTAARWAARYRQAGAAGMADRSSRPHASPARTARRTERRIIGLRVTARLGPARIGFRLGLAPSTIDNTLYDAFGQRQINTMYTQLNQYHVIMEAQPNFANDPQRLNKIYIQGNASSGASGAAASTSFSATTSSPPEAPPPPQST